MTPTVFAQSAKNSSSWVKDFAAIASMKGVLLDPSTVRDAKTLNDTIEAYGRGDLAGGDALKTKIQAKNMQVAAEWVAIRSGLPVGYERIKVFLANNPQWPLSRLIRNRIERAFLLTPSSPAEIQAFFASDPPLTGPGLIALGQAHQAQNNAPAATALFREAWREYQLSASVEASLLTQKPAVLTANDHRFRMERLLFQGAWRPAGQAATYAGPNFETLVAARMAVMKEEKNASAILAKVPEALRIDSSYLFSQSRFLRQQKKLKEAADLMATVPQDAAILVDGDEWWNERERLTRALLDAGDPKRAYSVASRHGAESAAKRLDAEFLSGWIALRFLKDPKLAAPHFAAAGRIGVTPISAARAAYWQGRAAEAAGANDSAQAFYRQAAEFPIAYYGQLAREKLDLPIAAIRPIPISDDPEVRSRVANMSAVKALDALRSAGAEDLALSLGIDIANGLEDVAELDAFATLCSDKQEPRMVLAIGKAALQRGLALDSHAYPLSGIPNFRQEGTAIEEALIYAISRQESAFDHRARSRSGALGLMQLMPGTAQETADRLKLAYVQDRLTADPVYNATLGSAYLGKLIKDWGGSHILAFAAYNAGSGNVRKWIAAYGDPRSSTVDQTDWVERIPFPETRNYVQRVFENYQVYRTRLPKKVQSSSIENEPSLRP